ncbi:MAG TPA: hypothetical protein VF522_09630 [Ramlibacter sp.]|uniref:hypothetical protein n=1 Tax=Ramlibacter sp. TaxID=1917967 RepID=UPI002ED0F936
MRFLLLLSILSSGIFYFFGSGEKERVTILASIAQAPRFTRASVDGVTRTLGRHESYQVRYKYEVDGVGYHTSTSSTDESGAREYLSAPVTEVAYDARDPSVAMLRQYYERRDPQETMGRALFVAGVLSLGMALPASLAVAWPLGWLRRRKTG